MARLEGERIHNISEADEAVVHIKGSKTDQYNMGHLKNQYRSGYDFCPVLILAGMQRRFPQRFGSEAHLP